jgi:hypothetical protein
MGRRRPLTILTAVTLGVGLPASAASAQLGGVPGVGDVVDEVPGEDCLDVDDLSLRELSRLGSDACLVEDGVVVDTTSAVAEATEELARRAEETTSAASETVERTADTARRATGGGGGETTPSAPSGGSDDGSSSGSSTGGPSGSTSDTGGAAPSGGTTTTTERTVIRGGQTDRPSEAEVRERERQLANIRALRLDMSRGEHLDRGIAGPVVPFGGLATTSLDLAAPQVAGGEVAPGVEDGGRLAPQVASGVEDEDAIFATSSPLPERDGVPLPLQLLATALVLGSGAIWVLSRRALDGSSA